MESGKLIEVLLVEDNPGDVRLTMEALRSAKVRNNVNVLSDGADVLRYLRQEPPYSDKPRPDLILLDLNLPRKSGHEVLEELKQDARLKSIPVVILPSSSAEADIAKSYKLHASSYVQKPVGLDEFLTAVQSIEGFWLSVVKYPAE